MKSEPFGYKKSLAITVNDAVVVVVVDDDAGNDENELHCNLIPVFSRRFSFNKKINSSGKVSLSSWLSMWCLFCNECPNENEIPVPTLEYSHTRTHTHAVFIYRFFFPKYTENKEA